ncbi:enoyl-CoA hydratase/isomerase family protein [bacterium]|nr:enoyl-CoA hydratase/isomerase family protein [bacterium]
MSVLNVTKEGKVTVVTMNDGKTANTFTDAVLREHIAVLEEIEKSSDDTCVVLTSSDPKFWCNGINLEWLMTQPGDYINTFKPLIDKMLYKWATLRVPTIANISGHAFGGGAILSCGFDFKFMRSDKGFFCFPEVDINIPFTDVMQGIIQLLPNKQALNDLAYTGRRIGGGEAAAKQIVDGAFPEAELWGKTMEMATVLAGKNRATYWAIKQGLKRDLIARAGL